MKPIEEYTTNELCEELRKRSDAILFGCVNQITAEGDRDIATYFNGDGKAMAAIMVRLIHRLGGSNYSFDEMLEYLKMLSTYVLKAHERGES